MKMIWIDLVLDTGELIRIECPSKFEDELHESINNARKRSDWWSTAQFEGAKAEFMGMLMDRVNMARVIGTL